MASNGYSINGLRLKTTEPPTLCSGCAFRKSHSIMFLKKINRIKATQPWMLIHNNICGPMNVPFHGGSLYDMFF